MRKYSDRIVYSPSDLIRYAASPFASWMDRYHLENPKTITPDEATADQELITQIGDQHEKTIFNELKSSGAKIIEVTREDFGKAISTTLSAIKEKSPIIYQGALEDGQFTGFADFLIFDEATAQYQVWDTKLARSPKPHYIIQLCCYSDMFAAMTGGPIPNKFGVILGAKERVEFFAEDFIHYYRQVKASFLAMQERFSGRMTDCPEPLPQADHGRWMSHAEKYFGDTDHLVRVAGISAGQIKKLRNAGVSTMTELSSISGKAIPKLAADSLAKLVAQARLQCQTLKDRTNNPDAPARYEVLPRLDPNQESVGLAAIPPDNPADVFFDMEGYPLTPGGLEYLFGACSLNRRTGFIEFYDWWAHDRAEEKRAFEGFIDWVYKRWKENPSMHIYHYAAYEVSAVRRLSTRHDTRQEEVDDLLRNDVFVDLYQVVRHGLRIGEDSYSIKSVERLYRPRRGTEVATAVDSIVQYALWMESGQARDWKESQILKGIRDYNEDDCKSTVGLLQWLRKIATQENISPAQGSPSSDTPQEPKELSPEVVARLRIIDKLRAQNDPFSATLADLVDFHRREEKPVWWRMFDRAEATSEQLRDDSGCIEGVQAVGSPTTEKRSQLQAYSFDPSQECKLADGSVMFTHNLEGKFELAALNLKEGGLQLKIGEKSLKDKFGGVFPKQGSLIPYEHISAKVIQLALTDGAAKQLSGDLHRPVVALFGRVAPAPVIRNSGETTIDAAIRVAVGMAGGCFVIQGPPGTGKTYTAAHVINALLGAGKKVGVASNSHKAVVNLLVACGEVVRKKGGVLKGIKVGGGNEGPLFSDNPDFRHIKDTGEGRGAYSSGVVGGTAWLFSRPEWEGVLDFLFIDEAGQVSLANAVAISQCAGNIVLLGDQMQLEQPIQGSHPGDAGLSSLQYVLKDMKASQPDSPVFHAVVPSDYGLFLGESRRMHPAVCRFISESIYEGRLASHPHCARQRIALRGDANALITMENGIAFIGVEHDGNIQKSDEEVRRVKAVFEELLGRPFTASDGTSRPLALEDFLFIAPYNAQVRSLQKTLPEGARVGSVDKFQGQEAPVCILSLCSSYGEYGSRGLAFILDRNRINVAISRAQCLAVVIADPRLASTTAGSIDEMKLLNVFCKLTATV